AAPAVRELITLVPDGGARAPAPVVRRAPAPVPVAVTSAPPPDFTAPGGFKEAWSDDRLNALRGPRTDAGDAAMARIWTNTVPRELRARRGGHDGAPPALVLVDQAPLTVDQKAQALADKFSGSITQSSKSPDVSGVQARFVQVGTFAVGANARALAARLGALGLPVTIRTIRQGGRALQIVLAGPFALPAQAQNALIRSRRAGFSDAFLRR
ncbi:MAG: SPOR domain-containing protein, partial [Paracoccaceae bacterium]